MTSNKKYGLILPEKTKGTQPTFQATRNVFGDDSDSDDDPNKKPILLRPSDNINRQSKITQEKAVLEDPTVYQYDEIYDSMASKKEEKKIKSKVDKKPKYIENLMRAADKRKIENERRLERQIQKERENEGEEFADKEVFVTSAYKKKLEELRKEEEKEKYEEYLESIGDVTKQKDLGGFYRHLYEQKLGTDKSGDPSKDKEVDSLNSSVEEMQVESKFKNTEKLQTTKKRNYRKRKSSMENKKHLSDGEIEDSDEEINRCNLEGIKLSKKAKQNEENIDADSDFSIDESSDEDKEIKNNENSDHKPMDDEENKTIMPPPERPNAGDNIIEKKEILPDKCTPEVKKIDIWKKRTVGEVFDQALIRYYERKARRA